MQNQDIPCYLSHSPFPSPYGIHGRRIRHGGFRVLLRPTQLPEGCRDPRPKLLPPLRYHHDDRRRAPFPLLHAQSAAFRSQVHHISLAQPVPLAKPTAFVWVLQDYVWRRDEGAKDYVLM